MFIILMDVCKYFFQGDGGGGKLLYICKFKKYISTDRGSGFRSLNPPDPHPPRIGFFSKIDIDFCGFN